MRALKILLVSMILFASGCGTFKPRFSPLDPNGQPAVMFVIDGIPKVDAEPGPIAGALWDWREGEKLKTVGNLLLTAGVTAFAADSLGVIDLDDYKFWESNRGGLNNNEAEVYQAVVNSQKDVIRVGGDDNTISFIDVEQGRASTFEISGDNNNVTIDKQQDSFPELLEINVPEISGL
tara:strand:- start:118 stop:651 length:534 start_codon:yes stop_codon:yes gene_type:complete